MGGCSNEGLWAVRNGTASPVHIAAPSGAALDVTEGQAVLADKHVWFATRTGLYQLKARSSVLLTRSPALATRRRL